MRALAGAAIGAGLVFVSSLGGFWLMESKRSRQAIVLSYTKGGGTTLSGARKVADDPTPVTVPATRYAIWIASRCQLKQWTMMNNEGVTDVPEQAILNVPQEELADWQFNCLASFVKPEYVTLTRTTY